MPGGFVYDFAMENIIRQTTELALHIVRAYVKPGDIVVDATCGNGKDTLALAEMRPAGLYAFDVQEEAVRETIRLLEANGYGDSMRGSSEHGWITVRQLAHEKMPEFFRSSPDEPLGAAPLKVVIFNLGYLPGGNKAITTRADTTLTAVQGAMELIAPDGLVCVTMYSGHSEGEKEKAALLRFAEELDAGKWHCAYISMPNQQNHPPEILLITRKR